MRVRFLDQISILKETRLTMLFSKEIEKSKIALVMDKSNSNELRSCEVCLQSISDFAKSPDVRIIMATAKKR